MNRRHALNRMAGGAAGSLLAAPSTGAATAPLAPAGVPPGRRVHKPLPFDPTRLSGLCERLIVSHALTYLESAVGPDHPFTREARDLAEQSPAGQ